MRHSRRRENGNTRRALASGCIRFRGSIAQKRNSSATPPARPHPQASISTYNFAEVRMGKDNNVGFIEAIYDAYAQGDSQFILDRITDDVDWVNEGPDSIPYAGTFKGPDGVRRFFEGLGGSVDNGRVSVEDFIGQDDKVVATGRFSATVKATGKRIDVP